MDTPLDLYRANRAELVAVIVRQREQIADLEQRVARQEAELAALRLTIRQLSERVGELLAASEPPDGEGGLRPSGMPGLKPTSPRAPQSLPPPPRKRRLRGYGRPRMRPTCR